MNITGNYENTATSTPRVPLEIVVVNVIRAGLTAGKTDIFDQLAWYLRFGFTSVEGPEKQQKIRETKEAFLELFSSCGSEYMKFSNMMYLDAAIDSRNS